MSLELISTAEHYGEAIDCRCLSFAFEFYQMSDKLIVDLSTEMVLWLNSFLKDGFISKRFDMHTKSITVEKALSQLKIMVQLQKGWSYGQEAYAASSIVYNQKTMSNYSRRKRTELIKGDIHSGVSVDYPQYWKELFPNGREDDDSIKRKIHRIFKEKNRNEISGYCLSDVQALLSICPYWNEPKSFWGSFKIDFSAFCLNDHLEDMADYFAKYARTIAEKYVNVNARVRLQPPGSTHMRYFGGDGKTDNSHIAANCRAIEWYSTYYLPEVEWLNIISPLARKHLPNLIPNTFTSTMILLDELNGGGLLLKSKKPITQYGIFDALELKRLVSPALYPGSSYKSLRDLFQERDLFKQHPTNFWFSSYPRSDWAIVPIFEEEVKVVATYLVFSAVKE